MGFSFSQVKGLPIVGVKKLHQGFQLILGWQTHHEVAQYKYIKAEVVEKPLPGTDEPIPLMDVSHEVATRLMTELWIAELRPAGWGDSQSGSFETAAAVLVKENELLKIQLKTEQARNIALTEIVTGHAQKLAAILVGEATSEEVTEKFATGGIAGVDFGKGDVGKTFEFTMPATDITFDHSGAINPEGLKVLGGTPKIKVTKPEQDPSEEPF